MSDRPAIVFGASGFIGRWVVRELLQRSQPVVGVLRAGSEATFHGWGRRPEFVYGDLSVPGVAAELVAQVRPGAVFNLAGYGVDRAEREPYLAERLNAGLVAELVDTCVQAGVPLVHIGSALEYGAAGGVLDETTAPEPTTLYGRTKLQGTQAVIAGGRDRELHGVTARLFTVFGDGEHGARLFPSLRAAAQSGASVPLTSGVQRRDFAWAGDVAALLADLSVAPFIPGEVVNLASGRMHTVRAFAEECAHQLGIAGARLGFGQLETRPDEMAHDGVSVARLQALVGRTATGELRESIRNALATSVRA